jgi:hypothetical protein
MDSLNPELLTPATQNVAGHNAPRTLAEHRSPSRDPPPEKETALSSPAFACFVVHLPKAVSRPTCHRSPKLRPDFPRGMEDSSPSLGRRRHSAATTALSEGDSNHELHQSHKYLPQTTLAFVFVPGFRSRATSRIQPSNRSEKIIQILEGFMLGALSCPAKVAM